MVFVPDDQIDRQSLQSPVGVRLDELSDEINFLGVADAQQHDRQVTGDAVSPESRLSARVLRQDRRVRSTGRIGIHDRAGQPSVELSIGLGGIELAQIDLPVSPRHIENAIRQMPVVILVDQHERSFARVGHAGDEIEDDRFIRCQRQGVTDRDDRIEDRTGGVRQLAGSTHRCRIGHRAASPEKLQAIRFKRHLTRRTAAHGHQMQHPGRVFLVRTGPSRTEDHVSVFDDFRLHEQIGKGRMRGVGGGWSENHFGIAGQLNRARNLCAVRDRAAPDFDVVFGRDGNLRVHPDIAVASPVFGTSLRKDRLVLLRRFQ